MDEQITSEQREAVADILRARARRERAQQDERDTIQYAHSIGVSYADIGRALGVSRQSARKYGRGKP